MVTMKEKPNEALFLNGLTLGLNASAARTAVQHLYLNTALGVLRQLAILYWHCSQSGDTGLTLLCPQIGGVGWFTQNSTKQLPIEDMTPVARAGVFDGVLKRWRAAGGRIEVPPNSLIYSLSASQYHLYLLL